MPIAIRQFPCLADNYGFLVRDEASGLVACIDTPDAEAILRDLDRAGWPLALILNTHWHPDHAGGDAAVQAATGATIVGPAEVRKIAPLDREVGDGDIVELGATRFEVLETGGHTLGHLSYYDAADGAAFVGDTLFAMGCGRLFEGPPAQMWTSLKPAGRPAGRNRRVLRPRIHRVQRPFRAQRRYIAPGAGAGGPGVRAAPSGPADGPHVNRAGASTNPFLRAPDLAGAVGVASGDPVEAFAALRAAKDSFRR